MENVIHHADHGVSALHVVFGIESLVGTSGFFIRTIELPAMLPDLMSGIHGPIAGDEPVPDSECEMIRRGERPNLSRLCGRAPRATRQMTMIGIVHPEHVEFFTVYGGPCAPREIGDPSLEADTEAARESAEFWAQHALSR